MGQSSGFGRAPSVGINWVRARRGGRFDGCDRPLRGVLPRLISCPRRPLRNRIPSCELIYRTPSAAARGRKRPASAEAILAKVLPEWSGRDTRTLEPPGKGFTPKAPIPGKLPPKEVLCRWSL